VEQLGDQNAPQASSLAALQLEMHMCLTRAKVCSCCSLVQEGHKRNALGTPLRTPTRCLPQNAPPPVTTAIEQMPSAQHVMLAVHCKKTDQIDIKAPILAYIRHTYSDREADEAVDDLAAVQGLRNDLVQAQSSATGTPRKESLIK